MLGMTMNYPLPSEQPGDRPASRVVINQEGMAQHLLHLRSVRRGLAEKQRQQMLGLVVLYPRKAGVFSFDSPARNIMAVSGRKEAECAGIRAPDGGGGGGSL